MKIKAITIALLLSTLSSYTGAMKEKIQKLNDKMLHQEYQNELYEALLTNKKITLEELLSSGYQLIQIHQLCLAIGKTNIANKKIYQEITKAHITQEADVPQPPFSPELNENTGESWSPIYYIDAPKSDSLCQASEETIKRKAPQKTLQKASQARTDDGNSREASYSIIEKLKNFFTKPYTKLGMGLLLIGGILTIISSATN